MERHEIQEQLAALYLRLNGYFVSGFIVHSPPGDLNLRGEPRKNRTEIDVLAVRFPYNAEPERQVRHSEYLQVSTHLIDLLICEVKGGEETLQFNKGLRDDPRAIKSVLRWAGVFREDELDGVVNDAVPLLSTQYPNNPKYFRQAPAPRSARIRAVFFAPDREHPVHRDQPRYIHGQEMIDWVWRCLRPDQPRSDCETRYDFGLWGLHERIVRFFKDREGTPEKPVGMQAIYDRLKGD